MNLLSQKKNWRTTRLLAFGCAIIIALTFSLQANAKKTQSGSIGSVTCNASLTRMVESSVATTTCSSGSATCSVSVSMEYYYKDAAGVGHSGTASGSAAGTTPVTKTVNGSGSQIQSIHSYSQHDVVYSAGHWGYSLNE